MCDTMKCGRIEINPEFNFLKHNIDFVGIAGLSIKKHKVQHDHQMEEDQEERMLSKLKSVKLNVRTIAVVTVIPLVLAALFIVLAALSGLPFLRFDAGYFTPEYEAQYAVPADVLDPLETALQAGDRAAYRELSGLRVTPIFPRSDHIEFVALLDRTASSYSYLFWDPITLERYEFTVEYVRGRWVATPADLSFYLRTGRWLRTWTPIAAAWWLIELTLLIIVGLNALMKRWKQDLYPV